jgi:hypothetical protein
MSGHMPSWRQKTVSTLALLVVVALGARAVYELLAPLVPVLVIGLVLFGLWSLVMRIRRY